LTILRFFFGIPPPYRVHSAWERSNVCAMLCPINLGGFMGPGLCLYRFCQTALCFSSSLFLALTVFVPATHAQSSGAPTVATRNTSDPGESDVDVAHISNLSRRDLAKNLLRIDVNLVTVQVSVTDAMNHAVTGLRKEDFALYEGETRQEIRHFSEEDGPISVGLILDLSKSMTNKVETERAAVEEFFRNANPEDDYFVIAVSSHPKVIADSTRSLRAIETELGLAVPDGNTALLDAVYLGIAQMRTARYARHALLIISDGGDNSSRYKLGEIKSILRESDVEVYAIGLFDTALFKTFEEYMGKKWLGEITDATGGRTVPVDNLSRLPATAAEISWELRNQYLIGYKPNSLVADGQFRKITVNVVPITNLSSNTPHLRAYYKEGYSASGR
jgi:Ca-activated chloride channel homolog